MVKNIKRAIFALALTITIASSLAVAPSAQVAYGDSVNLTGGYQEVDYISFNGKDIPAIYPGYQCAELVMRFYSEVYGFNVFNLYSSYSTPVGSNGEKFTATREPRKGDIVRFQDRTHWALVKDVDADGTVTLIEQNWNMGGYVPINRTVDKDDEIVTFFTYEGYVNYDEVFSDATDDSKEGLLTNTRELF